MAIHALWAHPRSVSTAFERIMRARGDLTVLHEPFLYHYYLSEVGEMFPDFEPEPGHPTTYADIKTMIRQSAAEGSVFFKDMGYYVLKKLSKDTDFAKEMTHAFLVRDPAESILSYHRRDPDFASVEVGIAAQHALFQCLTALGLDPLVITADQLRHAPEATLSRYWAHVGLPFAGHAFEWDDDEKVPEGWEAVQGWHESTLSKTAIEAPDKTRDTMAELSALGAPFTGYEAEHRPHYEALKDIAERQAKIQTGPHAAT